jgi:hypothetical protein
MWSHSPPSIAVMDSFMIEKERVEVNGTSKADTPNHSQSEGEMRL